MIEILYFSDINLNTQYVFLQIVLETIVDLAENSDVEIIWSFECRPIVLDERRIVECRDLTSNLQITRVGPEDSGSYTCTAITPSQSETHHFTLKVET